MIYKKDIILNVRDISEDNKMYEDSNELFYNISPPYMAMIAEQSPYG